MNKQLEQVIEFNKVFGTGVTEFEDELLLDLIEEEFEELKEAFYKKDRIGALDAICDLQYVLYGAVHRLKFENVFDEAFERVHQSNMSKMCDTLEEAIETQKNYAAANINSYLDKKNDRYAVIRELDRKILKSINYKPVDLSDLV